VQNVYKLIRLNRAVRNHRIKFAAVLVAHTLKMRHLFLRFDPVMACNLRCRMCYFSNDEYVRQIKGQFSEAEVDRIAELFFPLTMQLVIGCGTEPTLYKDFPRLVRIAKRYRIPFVGFTTNAQLLSEAQLGEFVDDKLDELTVSVHGVRKETYEHFMSNASYETLHDNLRALERVKRNTQSALPRLRINYTVNAQNLEELPEFFSRFGEYSIEALQVRPINDFGGEFRTMLSRDDMASYTAAVTELGKECRKRGITYLANLDDPQFLEPNTTSVILQAVRRHITPQIVWKPEFDWRTESYADFCRRTKWSAHLRKIIFSDMDAVKQFNAGMWGEHSAKYDVI
jgi:MoaA/NifB/PqqE/SkfB family radical SAM enzyme